MNTEPLHIISLGAGVQSSTMALMAAAGEITPMPTAAIFADTQDEPASVYRWLDWLEKNALWFEFEYILYGSPHKNNGSACVFRAVVDAAAIAQRDAARAQNHETKEGM